MFPTYAIIKVVDDEEKNIKDTILAFLKICLIVCKMHIYDRIPVYETVMQVLSLLK